MVWREPVVKAVASIGFGGGVLAGSMSGGPKQMLATGHALMARPRYLLIDEISLGLAPLVVMRLATVVADLASKGIGILLVEQFIEVAMALSSKVIVLRKGEVRLKTTPDAVATDRGALHRAYLLSKPVGFAFPNANVSQP